MGYNRLGIKLPTDEEIAIKMAKELHAGIENTKKELARIRLGYGTAAALGIYGNTYKWDDVGRAVVKDRYITENKQEAALGHQGTMDVENLKRMIREEKAEKAKPKRKYNKLGIELPTEEEIAIKMAKDLHEGIEKTKKELARIRLGHGAAAGVGIYGNTYKWDEVGRDSCKRKYMTTNKEFFYGNTGKIPEAPNPPAVKKGIRLLKARSKTSMDQHIPPSKDMVKERYTSMNKRFETGWKFLDGKTNQQVLDLANQDRVVNTAAANSIDPSGMNFYTSNVAGRKFGDAHPIYGDGPGLVYQPFSTGRRLLKVQDQSKKSIHSI